MAIVDQKRPALPGAATRWSSRTGSPRSATTTRTSTQLEAEQLWPRVWQMACRLEEIPQPYDFAEYEILDQSVIVVRTEDLGVHGVPERLPPPRRQGRRRARARARAGSPARSTAGATAPTARTRASRGGGRSPSTTCEPGDIDLTPVRCETWGGCAWINLDPDAPPLRECLEPFATSLDAWKVESLRTEWWYACRLPVNWKLADRGVRRGVPRAPDATRSSSSPRGTASRSRRAFDAAAFVDADLHYLRAMSEGMAGMVHANDVRHRRGPPRHRAARRRRRGDGDLEPHAQRRGHAVAPRPRAPTSPTSTSSRRRASNLEFFQGFPQLLRAADVQQRVVLPVPPARARRRR